MNVSAFTHDIRAIGALAYPGLLSHIVTEGDPA